MIGNRLSLLAAVALATSAYSSLAGAVRQSRRDTPPPVDPVIRQETKPFFRTRTPDADAMAKAQAKRDRKNAKRKKESCAVVAE